MNKEEIKNAFISKATALIKKRHSELNRFRNDPFKALTERMKGGPQFTKDMMEMLNEVLAEQEVKFTEA
jgi:hypothetical protein